MKVRFEIDIDYPEIIEGFPNDKDEIFRGADGQLFLFRDKITQQLFVACCDKGLSDTKTYAQLMILTLPTNTRIIDSDEYEQDPVGQTYSLLADGLQTLRTEIKESCTEILNTIEERDKVVTEGISENTMLEALRIVTKSKEG